MDLPEVIEIFKENPMTMFVISLIIMGGMLGLASVGLINMREDPLWSVAWWINFGVFLLSDILLYLRDREKEFSERWSLMLESPPTPHGVIPMESKSSQSSEPRDPGIRGNIEAPLESSPLAELEDVEAFGPHTLEQAKLEALEQQSSAESLEPPTLEQPILEQETLEPSLTLERPTLEKQHALEQEETLEPPTKEELQRLKEALGLETGSLHYKRRGRGIYHVTYDSATKKYRWTHVGSWLELKPKLKE